MAEIRAEMAGSDMASTVHLGPVRNLTLGFNLSLAR
jgi:hypothetical protein